MAASVEITGFPNILRATIVQCSDARPGRIVIESTVTTDAGIAVIPRQTTMTASTDAFSATWNNIRAVKTSRTKRSMRTVFEDDRWLLWERTMSANYNERNDLGELLTGQEKTIDELVTEIATVTGLSMEADVNVPTFKPPARWAGRLAGECLGELLWWTGCRLVYSPQLAKYFVTQAATGVFPDVSGRVFRPAPQCKFRKLNVRSYPIMYEDTLDCTAKRINTTTGETEALGSAALPTSPTEAYGQTRFRLWEPDGVTSPSALSNDSVLYLDHRAKSHLFDPENRRYEKARIVRDSFERYPHHEPFTGNHGTVAKAIELTGGGRAYLTEHPVLMTDATGVLLETCQLVTAYHVRENGDLKRDVVSVDLDGTEGEKTIDVDWIRPVDSTLSDLSGADWSVVHQEVADAMANHFKGESGLVVYPSVPAIAISGHIGGVKYEFDVDRNPTVRTSVAVNYIPGERGAV